MQRLRHPAISYKTLLVLATALPASIPAMAQDRTGSGVDSDGEIVVTALRRATNVQDTPLAITAVDGETLTSMGISDATALSKISPGLVIREGSVSGSRLTIRNIRAAGEPTVGLYYDETPLMGSAGTSSDAGGLTPDIRLFDVERGGVLRGPQGTLYGSSSMAGTVRLVFAKPNMNTVEATASGQMSDVAHGGVGFENQAMINLPVVPGLLSVRAVGFYRQRPGYVDSVLLNQRDVNDQNSKGGRILVRFEPLNGLRVDGLAMIQDTRSSLNDYFLAAGPFNAPYETLQPASDKLRIYSGTLTWDIGPVTATAIGSHSYRNFTYSYDISAFFRAGAARFPAGSDTANLYDSQAPSVANSPQITKTDTLEARLAGNDDGPLHWTAGFFYSDRKGYIDSNIARADPRNGIMLPLGAGTLLGQRLITDQLKQRAGFAEITYDLTHSLSLTGGLRYFTYDRRVTGEVTVPNVLLGILPLPKTDQSSSESGWLYKANASYKVAPDIMVYATASSGQRPGGVNQTVNLPATLQAYQSDKVLNYEVGIKSRFLDRAVTINADIFQIDWNNIQTSGSLPTTNFVFIANAGRARVRGIEAETTVVPYDGLQFQVSGSYIDARLREDQSNQSLVASGLKGDEIPAVPKVTLQGSAEYGWNLNETLKAMLRSDVYYSGASWTEFRHTSAFQRLLPSYALVSLRAGISGADDDWRVSLFVNNLLDDNTVVNKVSAAITGGLNNVRAISNVPRTVGIDFMKRF